MFVLAREKGMRVSNVCKSINCCIKISILWSWLLLWECLKSETLFTTTEAFPCNLSNNFASGASNFSRKLTVSYETWTLRLLPPSSPFFPSSFAVRCSSAAICPFHLQSQLSHVLQSQRYHGSNRASSPSLEPLSPWVRGWLRVRFWAEKPMPSCLSDGLQERCSGPPCWEGVSRSRCPAFY